MPGNPAGSAGGVMVCHHPVRLASAAATVVCPDRPVRLGTSALGWRRRARERPVLAVLWWPCLTAPSCAIVTSSTSIFTSTDFVLPYCRGGLRHHPPRQGAIWCRERAQRTPANPAPS